MLMYFFHKSILAVECAGAPINLDKRRTRIIQKSAQRCADFCTFIKLLSEKR